MMWLWRLYSNFPWVASKPWRGIWYHASIVINIMGVHVSPDVSWMSIFTHYVCKLWWGLFEIDRVSREFHHWRCCFDSRTWHAFPSPERRNFGCRMLMNSKAWLKEDFIGISKCFADLEWRRRRRRWWGRSIGEIFSHWRKIPPTVLLSAPALLYSICIASLQA